MPVARLAILEMPSTPMTRPIRTQMAHLGKRCSPRPPAPRRAGRWSCLGVHGDMVRPTSRVCGVRLPTPPAGRPPTATRPSPADAPGGGPGRPDVDRPARSPGDAEPTAAALEPARSAGRLHRRPGAAARRWPPSWCRPRRGGAPGSASGWRRRSTATSAASSPGSACWRWPSCRSPCGPPRSAPSCSPARSAAGACVTTSACRCAAADIPLGLLAGVAAQAVVSGGYALVGPAGGWRSTPTRRPGRSRPRAQGAAVVAVLLLFGVVAPVRGGAVLPRPAAAGAGARHGQAGGRSSSRALIFAGIHFELLLLPGLFVAGLLFGYLAQRSGRLGPAIFAHVGFNAATIVALAWSR